MSRLFRRGAVLLLASALVLCTVPVSALAQMGATVTAPAARSSVIVGVSDAGHMAPVREALEAAGGSIKKTYAWNAFLVSAPVGTGSAAFSAIAERIAGVTYAQGNATVHAAGTVTVNDPAFGAQWGLTSIGAPAAWGVSEGSGVAVAELDSGIDSSQPDLAGRVVMDPQFNYVVLGSPPFDDFDYDGIVGHGTHVAGILAATLNNGIEGVGTAPLCTLYAVKVLDQTGSGDDATVAQAIRDVVDRTPCKIISMSLGGAGDTGADPPADPVLASAVGYAQSKGALVVAAAGNDATASPEFPAAIPGVVGVGAVDRYNDLAYYSNFGSPDEDIVAPGGDGFNDGIWSTIPGDTMQQYSGTSMATPFVSGSAALVWSAHPSWTATEVADALENTAQDLGSPGKDATYGYGLVRPDLALDATGSAPPTSTPPATETITAAASASSVKLRVSFVLSGTLTPSTVGRTVVVLVQKPGSGRWSYSSARLTYGTAANGGALWWYRYVPIVRGTYRFQSTFAGDASGTAAASRLVSVSVR